MVVCLILAVSFYTRNVFLQRGSPRLVEDPRPTRVKNGKWNCWWKNCAPRLPRLNLWWRLPKTCVWPCWWVFSILLFRSLSKYKYVFLIQDKRFAIDSIEKNQLQKCLDTLQHSIKVTSFQSMVERLESLARQLGWVFVVKV